LRCRRHHATNYALFLLLWVFSLNVKARTESSAELELISSTYYRSNQKYFDNEDNSSNISSVGVNLKLHGNSENFESFIDGQAFISFNEGESYLNPREIYLSGELGDWQGIVGRYSRNWSKMDSFWSMGHWNPRFLWDPLVLNEAGLTGLFFSNNISQNLDVHMFFSPYFLPDFGVNVVAEDGHLSSANPWFRRPNDFVNIAGNSTPIEFSLEKPDANDVLNNSGGGIQLVWGTENYQLRVAHARKPMNPIHIRARMSLITGEGSSRLETSLLPEVVHERLNTAEMSFIHNQWTSWISATHSEPLIDDVRPNEMLKSIDPTWIYGAFVNYEERFIFNQTGHLYLGILALVGGDQPDAGEFEFERTNFPLRYEYTKALRLGWKQRLPDRGNHQLHLLTEATYDLDQNAGLLTINLRRSLSSKWQMNLRADFIGLLGTGDVPNEDGFLRHFRANDRIVAGVKYVY